MKNAKKELLEAYWEKKIVEFLDPSNKKKHKDVFHHAKEQNFFPKEIRSQFIEEYMK